MQVRINRIIRIRDHSSAGCANNALVKVTERNKIVCRIQVRDATKSVHHPVQTMLVANAKLTTRSICINPSHLGKRNKLQKELLRENDNNLFKKSINLVDSFHKKGICILLDFASRSRLATLRSPLN